MSVYLLLYPTSAVDDGYEEDSMILPVRGVQPPLLLRVLRPLDAHVSSVSNADGIHERWRASRRSYPCILFCQSPACDGISCSTRTDSKGELTDLTDQ